MDRNGTVIVAKLERGEPGRQFGLDPEAFARLQLTRNLAEEPPRPAAPAV